CAQRRRGAAHRDQAREAGSASRGCGGIQLDAGQFRLRRQRQGAKDALALALQVEAAAHEAEAREVGAVPDRGCGRGGLEGRPRMSHLDHAERAFSRRKFLAMGGALAAAGTVGSWVDPRSTLVSSAWPKGPLVDADAVRVRESQFLSVGQFRQLHKDADRVGPANQRGLRATGSEEEARYVDGLREQLEDFGVVDLHFESVPMRRWTTTEWSLDVVSGTAGGPVKTASYIPYSGQTQPEGVTGSLVFVPRGTT